VATVISRPVRNEGAAMTETQPQSSHRHNHTLGGDADPRPLHHHTHGAIDPSLFTASRGMWAIKRPFVGLLVTAVLQAVVVLFSGSVAMTADAIHNAADAATAVAHWASDGERQNR